MQGGETVVLQKRNMMLHRIFVYLIVFIDFLFFSDLVAPRLFLEKTSEAGKVQRG